MPGCVMSIFDVVPKRIGGIETFARELSSQLASAGWRSVLCFRREPAESVRRFLEVPGIAIEAAPEVRTWTADQLARWPSFFGCIAPTCCI